MISSLMRQIVTRIMARNSLQLLSLSTARWSLHCPTATLATALPLLSVQMAILQLRRTLAFLLLRRMQLQQPAHNLNALLLEE